MSTRTDHSVRLRWAPIGVGELGGVVVLADVGAARFTSGMALGATRAGNPFGGLYFGADEWLLPRKEGRYLGPSLETRPPPSHPQDFEPL